MDPLLTAAQQVMQGQSLAFRIIVEATHARLLRLGLRILGDLSAAEDVLQDAYVKAHQALVEHTFDGRSTIETWLYRIVTHAAIDAARRGRRWERLRRAFTDWVPHLQADPDSRIALGQLAEWLHRLPEDQYATLMLKVVEGLSSAEVAAVLECSEGAVEQRLFRARSMLRRWADEEPEQVCAPLLTELPLGGTRA
jgi:RNA polymerase sigma-70 factor (ECF subfamily)